MRPTTVGVGGELLGRRGAALGRAQAVLGDDLGDVPVEHRCPPVASTAIAYRVQPVGAERPRRRRTGRPSADDDGLAGRDLDDAERVLGGLGRRGRWQRDGKRPAAPMMPSVRRFIGSRLPPLRSDAATGSRRRARGHGRARPTRSVAPGPDAVAGGRGPPAATHRDLPPGATSWSPMPVLGHDTLRASTVAADAFAYDSQRRPECKTSERPGRVRAVTPSGGPGSPGAARSMIRRRGRRSRRALTGTAEPVPPGGGGTSTAIVRIEARCADARASAGCLWHTGHER